MERAVGRSCLCVYFVVLFAGVGEAKGAGRALEEHVRAVGKEPLKVVLIHSTGVSSSGFAMIIALVVFFRPVLAAVE